ncbi:MAG: phosphate ABC transporter substrate-binding protein [Eubacteriales bacterium]|nr:phosphate ABC transporter substrate-binding protein [Eubacteriales bacterium]
MMKRKLNKGLRIVLTAGLCAVMGMAVLTGCGSSDKGSSDSGSSSSTKTVTIAGSTSVQPLSEVLGEKYSKKHSDVKIDVQGGGSGEAVKSLKEGICQIGALSRDLEAEEKSDVGKQYTIAKDGVAIVVNKDVNIDDITLDQLKDIYTGKITNWKDVGGDDADIAVVSREEGSGTRGAFTEITGVTKDDKDNTTKDALVQSSTGAVVKTVKSTPNSIGYVSLEAVDNSVKAVKVEGVDASADTVLDGTYKISRPFIYVVGDKVDNATQDYIDYVMSDEGQKEVEKAGFIPVGNNK